MGRSVVARHRARPGVGQHRCQRRRAPAGGHPHAGRRRRPLDLRLHRHADLRRRRVQLHVCRRRRAGHRARPGQPEPFGLRNREPAAHAADPRAHQGGHERDPEEGDPGVLDAPRQQGLRHASERPHRRTGSPPARPRISRSAWISSTTRNSRTAGRRRTATGNSPGHRTAGRMAISPRTPFGSPTWCCRSSTS